MSDMIKRLAALFMCVTLVIGASTAAFADWDGESESQSVEASVGENGAGQYDEEKDVTQASTDISILVNSGVEIIGQTEDCYINVGDDLEIGIAVRGIAPFTYTWEVSTDEGKTWAPAEGAEDSRFYQITDAQLNPNGKFIPHYYRATVTDTLGRSDSTIIQVTPQKKNDFYYRRILDEKRDVAVSAWMMYLTELSAKKLTDGDPAYEELSRHLTPGCLPISALDLALTNKMTASGHYVGDVKVEFIVGEEYNGQTLKVFQLVDGEVVEYSGTVVDGILTITAEKLTQFMVEAPSDKAKVITVTSGEGGSTSPEGTVTVLSGEDKTVTILPDEGYVVGEVLVDGVPVEITGNSYTFENITADHTFEVSFEKVISTGETHTVTVESGANGKVSPSGSIEVTDGESLTLSITPNTGYVVDKVLVNGVEHETAGNFLTLSAVTADTTVKVTFKKTAAEPVVTSRVITATAGPGGVISPKGKVNVSYGGDMYFYIVPNEGYVVDKVLVDGKEVSLSGSAYHFVNVVSAHTISATFKPGDTPDGDFFTITAERGANGRISPEGELLVAEGGSQTFHFLPDSGYAVSKVYVNGELVATGGLSYTLTDVQADTTIRVEFVRISMVPTGDITDDGISYTWCWVLLGAAGVVAVLMIILILIRKKKEDEEEEQSENDE